MNFNKIADKIVFNSLRLIKHGSIELVNCDNKKYNFGNPNEELKVKIKINKPGLNYQIIKKVIGGSRIIQQCCLYIY